MKTHSTHKNLNTSYVNLSALLKFLQQQDFVGSIHFETKEYEADVFFIKGEKIELRENDHAAGRVSVGDEVLARLLARAYEPNGVINVFDENDEYNRVYEKNVGEIESYEFQVSESSSELRAKTSEIEFLEVEEETEAIATEKNAKTKQISLKEKLGLPNLPFSFKKKGIKKKEKAFESKIENGKELNETENSQNWNELLSLLGEILGTVEKDLTESNLNFGWVFDKVRAEISKEYSFLDPNSRILEYKKGQISMTEQVDYNILVESIAESLGLLLKEFKTHPRFAEVKRSVAFNIIELMNKNHVKYDKFQIAQQLEKTIDGI